MTKIYVVVKRFGQYDYCVDEIHKVFKNKGDAETECYYLNTKIQAFKNYVDFLEKNFSEGKFVWKIPESYKETCEKELEAIGFPNFDFRMARTYSDEYSTKYSVQEYIVY